MYSSFMSWSRHFSYEQKKIFQGSRMMNDASHWLPCVKVTFLWIITLNPYPKIHFLSRKYVKEEEMNCLSSQKIKAFAWHFHTLHFFQRLFSFLQLFFFPIYIRDSHLPIIEWCSCSIAEFILRRLLGNFQASCYYLVTLSKQHEQFKKPDDLPHSLAFFRD